MTEGRYRGRTKGTHFYLMLVNLHFVLEVSLGAFCKSSETSGSLCHMRVFIVAYIYYGQCMWILHVKL